ncbi:methyltransferase domain-containing protein [Antarctobacter jejuensis]|uniref:methyltransferase domain-containing protein n=1 Tax=Antarctobacter jejuensis TaxID=1439938 RepID=UPI003FD3A94E
MPDLYLEIDKQPDSVLEAIANSMEDRIADPTMQDICASYMGRLPGPGADVVEIGCGNGSSTELILQNMRPARLIGIDPAKGLLDRADGRFADRPEVSFVVGNACRTGLPGASADVVVAHTVYSHLEDPQAALAEAFRLLRPGGVLAVFDGDYAANTVSLFDGDPLQAAMEATTRNLIHAPYIMRHMPRMMTEAGFTGTRSRAHGFVQTENPAYFCSLLARGVTASANVGECCDGLAQAFQTEAQNRVAEGRFYGAILFASHVAQKPA